jgi:hypothetical protein
MEDRVWELEGESSYLLLSNPTRELLSSNVYPAVTQQASCSTLFIQVSVVRAELYQGVCGKTEIPRVKTHNTDNVPVPRRGINDA